MGKLIYVFIMLSSYMQFGLFVIFQQENINIKILYI